LNPLKPGAHGFETIGGFFGNMKVVISMRPQLELSPDELALAFSTAKSKSLIELLS
jgi:hypothetical protein